MNAEITALLSHNPPHLIMHPNRATPVAPTPLTFYDKHIDKHLLLRRVITVPSIRQALSRAVDQKLLAFENSGIVLPPGSNALIDQGRRDAFAIGAQGRDDQYSLMLFYDRTTAMSCNSLASLLAIYPSASSSWFSLLRWSQECGPDTTAQPYIMEDNALRLTEICSDDSKLPDCLSQDMKRLLRETFKRYPELATWQIIDLSIANEKVIQAMDKVAPAVSFAFKTCHTTGHPSRPDIPVPPDALKVPWTIPSKKIDVPWTHTRSRHSSASDNTKTSMVKPCKLGTSTKTKKSSVLVAKELIQHAWAQCTVKDTTLVVFHCGTLERIGVRDRKNQALYLTDVIDVHACKDPAYGKLHVGLYMTALEDALDRVKTQLEAETQVTQRAKVTTDTKEQGPRRKRVKTGYARRRGRGKKTQVPKVVKEEEEEDEDGGDVQVICNHVASRPLMLLYICYSTYNSPSPASFLRLDVSPASSLQTDPKTRKGNLKSPGYSSSEYITLVLTSYIGAGATGIVHDATLEIQREAGPPIIRDVVVKLSFTPEQRQRLLHEYSIYLCLSTSNTPGILRAFGLFEDVEGGALALVLEHGGISLWHREEVRTNSVTVSDSEREAFVACLDGIHKAGLVHNDIRPPNLLVNKDGNAFIVDFDKAFLTNNKQLLNQERDKLDILLDGEYTSDG